MTQFTQMRDEISAARTPNIVIDDRTASDIIISIFVMSSAIFVLADKAATNRPLIAKDKGWYRGKLKTETENFINHCILFQHRLTKNIKDTKDICAVADFQYIVDETIGPKYDQLYEAIFHVVNDEYHIDHAEEMARIYTLDTMVVICENVLQNIEAKYPNFQNKSFKLEKTVELSSRMTHQASEKTPASVRIDFNKQLTVMSKVRSLVKQFFSNDMIEKAFTEGGFAIYSYEETDEKSKPKNAV